jgi:hypothetical protein
VKDSTAEVFAMILRRHVSHRICIFALIVIHLVLVAGCAVRYGFAATEVGLLPTGILDWRYERFDVYRVNPPLVRMWATLPIMVVFDPEVPFRGVWADPRERAEWDVAQAMLQADPEAAYRWLILGRLFCLPFVAGGILVAARWAEQLYGRAAGIGAALLWAFFPNLIGFGCLISGDAQAASMGLITFYLFRSWLARPDLRKTYLLALTTGLTILTKSSWLILLGLLPLIWLAIRAGEWLGRRGNQATRAYETSDTSGVRGSGRCWRWQSALLLFAMSLALFIVNLLYGFGGTFRRLDSYDFISQSLGGITEWKTDDWSGNRFRGKLIGALPVPLPEQLVIGIDLQKWDFDRERWSYFRGEWRTEGWRHYYMYGLGIKVPLGFWILVTLSLAGIVRRSLWRAQWQEELLLWVPPLLILAAASLETGLNRHIRYVLPALPFAIVSASRAFRVFSEPLPILRRVATVATAWLVASSLWIYPHSLAYFNELIGGPLRADRHLNGSNLDWGQDLPYLRRWQNANPEAQPLWVSTHSTIISPESTGIETNGRVPAMPQADQSQQPIQVDNSSEPLFQPGWYVIDRETLLRPQGLHDYLRSLKPSAQVGYSFQIYQITPKQAEDLEHQRRRWLDDKHE